MTVVVAFDEFQQITEVKNKKIDAIIRKHIQKQQYTSYIFSGSKRHLLTELFIQQNNPLFNMATGIELKGIDSHIFYGFINKKLDNKLEKDAFDFLYNIVDGESKLIQQVCYHLFYLDENQLTSFEVRSVITRILQECDGECRIIMDRLTASQRIAMKAIAMFSGAGLFSLDNLHKLNISKQSMLSAIKSLYKSELIDKEAQRYFINDRKLELWCKNLYVGTI